MSIVVLYRDMATSYYATTYNIHIYLNGTDFYGDTGLVEQSKLLELNLNGGSTPVIRDVKEFSEDFNYYAVVDGATTSALLTGTPRFAKDTLDQYDYVIYNMNDIDQSDGLPKSAIYNYDDFVNNGIDLTLAYNYNWYH